VRILERIDAAPVLILTELPDNPSTSITNMMEHLAPEVIREFLPYAFEELEPVTVIERYPQRNRRDETFSLVRFERLTPRKVWLGGRSRISLGEPRWKHRSREDVRAFLGGYADEL
jgi:hypothetical protein